VKSLVIADGRSQQSCYFLFGILSQLEESDVLVMTFSTGTIIKFSLATSRVKWLNGEKKQRFEDHLHPRVYGCSHEHGARADTDGNCSHFRTLRPRTELVLDTLVFSPFNHLTLLVAR
jgi:hypothetical protein